MKKKLLGLFLIFSIILNVGCTPLFKTDANIETDVSYVENSINNTILIIGDGMSADHITAARTYLGHALTLDSISNKGYVNTLSYSGTTDSAAAATAMATGSKVFNKQISYYDGENLETILEIAKQNGQKTGVVSSDNLYGATPAAFSSHAKSRADTNDIINSQIVSEIDLLMGQGVGDYNSYSAAIQNAGYTYVNNIDNLNVENSKIFGVFDSINPNEIAGETSVNITQLAEFALDYLNNENGFTLIFEVADIDKRSHDNNLQEMIYEVLMLDQLVNTVLTWMGENNDTFLMVTADHETGGLTLDKTDTFENLLNTYAFTTTGHTNEYVPYYAVNYNIGENLIDNIDVFKLKKFFIIWK